MNALTKFSDITEAFEHSDSTRSRTNPMLSSHTQKLFKHKISPFVVQKFIEDQKTFLKQKSLNISNLQRSYDESILSEIQKIPSISQKTKAIACSDNKKPAFERLCYMGIHNSKLIKEQEIKTERAKISGPPSCYYAQKPKVSPKEIQSTQPIIVSKNELKSKFLKDIKRILGETSGESILAKSQFIDLLNELRMESNSEEENDLQENLYLKLSYSNLETVIEVVFAILYNVLPNKKFNLTKEELCSMRLKYYPLILNKLNKKKIPRQQDSAFSYKPIINPPKLHGNKLNTDENGKVKPPEEKMPKEIEYILGECTFCPCIIKNYESKKDKKLDVVERLVNSQPKMPKFEDSANTVEDDKFTFHALENPPPPKVEVHGFEKLVKRLNEGREQKKRIEKIVCLRASEL